MNYDMERICPLCATGQIDNPEVCPADGTAMVGRGSSADPFVGREVEGRLRIDRFLGSGGMGHVYVATQLDATRRQVAVKFVRSELLGSQDTEKRFFREVQMLASGSHASVVSVYFSGKSRVAEREVPYFAMELIAGTPLCDLMGGGRQLAPGRVVRLGLNILNGLAALHAQGLVHRDLKPANVLLLDGTDDTIKILDFGLAKPVQTEAELQITASNVVLGTPAYMSPEQMMGWELDGRSDLYSLGVMLFEMLSGVRPGADGSGSLPRLSQTHPQLQIDSLLSDFVARLLATDRDMRPSLATDAVTELTEIGKGLLTQEQELSALALEPTIAAPPTTEPLATEGGLEEPSGAWPWGLVIAAVVAIVVAAGLYHAMSGEGAAPSPDSLIVDVVSGVRAELTEQGRVTEDLGRWSDVGDVAARRDAPVRGAEISSGPVELFTPETLTESPLPVMADIQADSVEDLLSGVDTQTSAGAALTEIEQARPERRADHKRKVKEESVKTDEADHDKMGPEEAEPEVSEGGKSIEESVKEKPSEAEADEVPADAEDPESSILESE
jgi:tRNA A-37 threonylcarbamoyl transferase component Bud32